MANSKITITFTGEASANERIEFDVEPNQYIVGLTLETIEWYRAAGRTGSGTMPEPIGGELPTGYESANLFAYYWDLDYNQFGVFDVSVLNNVVTITDTTGTKEFTNWFATAPATVLIENDSGSDFELVEGLYQEAASDKCNTFQVSVETTTVADNVFVNGVEVESNNTDNPVVLTLNRGTYYYLKFTKDGVFLTPPTVYFPPQSRSTIVYNMYVPYLVEADIQVNVTPTFNGLENITAVYSPPAFQLGVDLEVEFSLDGVNYDSSGSFTNLEAGTYTIYARDQFGCVKTFERVLGGGTSQGRDPFLFISEANAVTFVESVDLDDHCANPKNDSNTLAFQSVNKVHYCEPHLFNTCDPFKIQFKSNYSTITATLRKEDAADVPLTVVQLSDNLDRFMRLSCTRSAYGAGQCAITFSSGFTYDEAGNQIGTHNLNGGLPDFAKVGNLIDFPTTIGAFYIKEVVFWEEAQQWAIIIDYNQSEIPVNTDVQCIYDLLPYNVFEFSVDWETQGVGLYDIVLVNQEDTDIVTHVTENIEVSENHADTVGIRYFGTNNRDIFYTYPIEHFIRVRYQDIGIDVQDESEIEIGDNTAYLTTSSVIDGNMFIFDEVPRNQAFKIGLALAHEYVFINNVGYVKDGSISIERIENTNLAKVEAKMRKTNFNYNNNRSGLDFGLSTESDVSLPTIITDGTNFIIS